MSFTYSADGLLTAYSDSRGRTWSTEYDRCGRPVAKRDPLDHGSSIRYDALGQVQRALDALGETASFRYDATGRLVGATDPMGNSTSAVYDAVGNLQVAFDALDRATHHVYDALDRRVSTVDPSGGLTQVSYDAVGRPTAITDPGGRTMRYAYDVLDHPVAEIHPDGSQITHQWDSNGNLLSSTDPRGFTTTYRYGPANRLLEVVRPDSTAVQLAYDANGNIMTTTDSTGTYSFAYDAEDRPLRITHDDRSFNLTYDGDGRILSLAYPDHRVVRWSYDEVGRVASVTMPDHGLTSFAYDAADRRTGVSFGNGTTALAEYDFNSRLTRLVHGLGASNVTPDLRYAHDAVGNVSSVSDGGTPLWTYGYDNLDQLVSAVDEQTSTTTTWTYDRSNNIASVTVNGVTTPYTCNELNQLTSVGTTELTWDGNGNLARKVDASGVTSYHFDSQDRLVEVLLPNGKRVSYMYDSRGRLVSRTSDEGTTTFEWAGWQLEREIDPSGRAMRFFYQGQEMVGFEMEAAYYTVHSDSQGHVRTMTDIAGATVYNASYDAWGNLLHVADSVPGGWNYRYVGGYGVRYDADSGLHYMRQRWYDAGMHRFVSRDRIIGSNRYVYASDNPTLLIDPIGLQAASPTPYSSEATPWLMGNLYNRLRVPFRTNGTTYAVAFHNMSKAPGNTSYAFIARAPYEFDRNADFRGVRLDHGYNVETEAVDYHWNSSPDGTLGVVDHECPNQRLAALGEHGGRIARGMFYVSAALDAGSFAANAAYSYESGDWSNTRVEAYRIGGGWMGAYVGAEAVATAGAWAGSWAGPPGVLIGAGIGGIFGGIVGYMYGAQAAQNYSLRP